MDSSSRFSALMMRVFAGLAGGLTGTVTALGIFLLSSLLLPGQELVASYSLVSILAMVFLSTLLSNLLTAFLLKTWEREKYSRTGNLIFQVFVFTTILFVFSIPFYLFAAVSLTQDALLSTAGMHFLISALICALVCEIMSGWKNSLTGLLGTIVAGCFLYGIFTLLFLGFGDHPLLLIFFLPIAWLCITLSIFLVETIHHSFFTYYGTTPLAPQEEGKP